MQRWTTISFVILSGILFPGCAALRPVSTRTLLAEMTDLRGLAEFPRPAYTCRQFSSYDRASTVPENAETWFANADANQYLRVEERADRKEYVMMDADGPGAIVRIWSANPQGTLRIYLDHKETPAIEAPMADLLGGKVAGIPEPIACLRSAGWNSYFPIPYARHCKVSSDSGGFYYHVNYRTYARGTAVRSFTPADLKTLQTDTAAVADRLASPRAGGIARTDRSTAPADERPLGDSSELQPGQSLTWQADRKGPGAIVGLRVVVDAGNRDEALRQLLLTLEFDGERAATCPLGDFFGAGPGLSPYESLPLGVTKDGEMWSHWVMPYHDSARLEIRNLGRQPARVRLAVATSPYRWTNHTLYFHAGWRVEREAPTRPFRDWNYVDIQGRGVFAGAAFTLANPVKAWWGEGDEKIYVDGEEFPSHFGTGTEDYYGYAWGSPAFFSHAYHSQPRCDGPGNYGRTAVNRWHILDRIPFQRSLRFDMELWHWWEGRVPEMSVVTYWYARPGATSNRAAPQPTDLRLTVLPPYVAPRIAGALEGEELRVVEKTGIVEPQEIGGCSNEQHLWWRNGQPGDKLVVAFPAPKAGLYRIFGRFLKAHDYGIVQLAINGREAGEPLDFYNNGIAVSAETLLGELSLLAADNTLAAEIVGANEKAAKKYMFGLDYLRLEPAD